MQNLVTKNQKLLNEQGVLLNPGYALYPAFEYHRRDISASIWRIKEWDYYAIINQDFGLTCTVADLAYSAMVTVVFLDFRKPSLHTKTKLKWFTFGKMNLPNTSLNGNVIYHSEDMSFEFVRNPDNRIIRIKATNFVKGETLIAEIELVDHHDDSMVIATPWKENKKAFYYNQKINCMPAHGKVTIGHDKYLFEKETSFGVLDWGRGVWTYKNTWYWSSLSSVLDGVRVGFNFGYGFGDTSKATENMVFYDGKAFKIDQVTFTFNQDNLMDSWKIKDNEGKIDLTLSPIIDRIDNINFGIIKNFGHQIFGRFNGTIFINKDVTLRLENIIGFAEQITNHY